MFVFFSVKWSADYFYRESALVKKSDVSVEPKELIVFSFWKQWFGGLEGTLLSEGEVKSVS